MRIPFDLGFVYHPGASDEDNAMVLAVLLEALTACDIIFLKRSKVPKLYKAGVTYGRTRVWDSIPDLYARRYGDCKSLTAARCAELRMAGEDAKPVFRFAQNEQTGHRDFHILVQRGNGTYEDPSRTLGMDEYHAARGLWLFPQ